MAEVTDEPKLDPYNILDRVFNNLINRTIEFDIMSDLICGYKYLFTKSKIAEQSNFKRALPGVLHWCKVANDFYQLDFSLPQKEIRSLIINSYDDGMIYPRLHLQGDIIKPSSDFVKAIMIAAHRISLYQTYRLFYGRRPNFLNGSEIDYDDNDYELAKKKGKIFLAEAAMKHDIHDIDRFLDYVRV